MADPIPWGAHVFRESHVAKESTIQPRPPKIVIEQKPCHVAAKIQLSYLVGRQYWYIWYGIGNLPCFKMASLNRDQVQSKLVGIADRIAGK